jgi:hypothetical protein
LKPNIFLEDFAVVNIKAVANEIDDPPRRYFQGDHTGARLRIVFRVLA